ncbi:Hypothetical protein NTJ_01029 [Nesidiocoris tenuis]|uniref:Uncharacterized protein n=1 Tax=Nesidiocoris tenuis TaxID=355587 RepID=A0ABN7A8D4_9HEMI|nr:Hypothetical protein NTJ_01029 [Nesidiocoris tenuis]
MLPAGFNPPTDGHSPDPQHLPPLPLRQTPARYNPQLDAYTERAESFDRTVGTADMSECLDGLQPKGRSGCGEADTDRNVACHLLMLLFI